MARFMTTKEASEKSKPADKRLKQINDRQYYVEMSAQGVKEILQYGIAFSGKSACIKVEVRKHAL